MHWAHKAAPNRVKNRINLVWIKSAIMNSNQALTDNKYAEEIKVEVQLPMEIHVDNASGVSFQKSTNSNSKLKGILDMREEWVMNYVTERK